MWCVVPSLRDSVSIFVLPSAYALGYLNAAAFGGWLLPPSLAAGPVFTKENPTLWVLYVSRLLATCVGLRVARVERVLLGRR